MDSNTERQLRDRIDELEEEVRQLKEVVRPVPNIAYRDVFKLSREQARFLSGLMQREIFTHEQYLAGRDYHEHGLYVQMYHLRRKLKKFDVAIENVWGEGYRLSPAAKARVRELVGALT